MTQPTRNDPPLWTPPPEFLRELPDMISGKDPELLKPEARAWMLRDPQARELAQQICGAVAMFADMPSRMTATATEPLSLRAKRSVERAARQLPQRLAEVLWPLLTLELDRVAAANGGAFVVPSLPFGSFASETEDLVRDREGLLEQLARADARLAKRISLEMAPRNYDVQNALAARAERLIAAFRVCLPKHSMGQWSSLLLDYFRGSLSRVSEWRSFIHSSSVTAYHDHVLQTAALIHESIRDFTGSIELCEQLIAWYPSSPARAGASYTGMKCSLLVGDSGKAWEHFRHFHRSLATPHSQRVVWQRQFLADGEAWRTAHESQPVLVGEVLSALGSQS